MSTQEVFKICFVKNLISIDAEMFEEHNIAQEIFSPSQYIESIRIGEVELLSDVDRWELFA